MKQKHVIGIFALVAVLGIAILSIFLSKSGFYGSADQDPEFIKHLPQLQNLDLSKEICFDLGSDQANRSTIDCFVPNDFSKHAEGIPDLASYKLALKSARVVNARLVEDEKKDPFLRFYDAIQPSPHVIGSGTYFHIKKALEGRLTSPEALAADFKNYIYLLSLEGKYDLAKKTRDRLCSRFSKTCANWLVRFSITGKVVTDKWSPVQWARLNVLGTSFSGVTNQKGEYSLSFSSFPGQKIRIEAFKPGFSNGVFSLDILSEASLQTFTKNFILNTPVQFAVIDTIRNTISGERTSLDKNNFVIETEWSRYQIPFGALVHRNGSTFRGKVTAYFFEFDKQSRNEDLLQNDIFDDVVGYAGNLMKTFWMPYVLFVTDEGERIHVLEKHPMILRSKIIEMQALRTNADNIYAPLTNADLEFLVEQSKKLGGYPVDREFLIEHDLLRYPLFWVFDQTKWTWVNQGAKVISAEWISEIPFYTISE